MFANWLSGYLTVVGAALTMGGLLLLASRMRLRWAGATAHGRIVGHVARMKSHVGEKPSFMPVVEFVAGQTTREFQSRSGGSAARWPVGREVQVRYDPARPDRAEIAEGLYLWMAPTGVLALAAGALLAAAKAAG